ncbi:sigma-70 family RNA polymerase sigma factor [Streptomyces sp. NPDC058200]|uniref:sigma-70 family RNA polymerase sigma factor n=1 Tax=Streptomyces sp. NPDC058200 TaxID=3346378 RepID=UPI0036EEB944
MPQSASSDQLITAWALAAGRGDGAALHKFVVATRPRLRRFVARFSGDAQSVDDLTQETYLRALSSLPRFAGRCHACTWLFSIARRVVVDRHRSNSARPSVVDAVDWLAEVERAQPVDLPGFDEGVALHDLLDLLDQDRRQSFVLTQLMGLSYHEAAAVAGCPVGTVRSRVSRARRHLTTLLHTADTAA